MLDDIQIDTGQSAPIGLSKKGLWFNFSLYASHASQVILGLRYQGNIREIPLIQKGESWHIAVSIPNIEGIDYAYKVAGLSDPQKGLFFDPCLWLQDPLALFPTSESLPWGNYRSDPWSKVQISEPFSWQGIQKPKIPFGDLIIYEMHVRGFTRHPSSQIAHPGTFLGLIEKIPYLKKLGINAVELMPIFLFDETRCKNIDPSTKNPLPNYWGYSPLSFFAPTGGFGSGAPVTEFKTLVRELHRNGIEVFLDVVYNHTGEGKQQDESFSFRGIDNSVYYMIDEIGHYRDFTGCKNTFNSNHPAVTAFILASLYYWVEEMQVDGFRFDLAAVHTRGIDGHVLHHPPLLEAIAKDERFSDIKLIAEGWDAVGLYMVESFPHFGPWSVWNGKFRDYTRQFIKGTDGFAQSFVDSLLGSPSFYHKYTPLRSINFITAHDGFTLKDLVSYNEKLNIANGEDNKDGNSQNISWNCGVDGNTQDPAICSLRERQERNFLLALFLAQGIPMLLMGDEYGHTRYGNNNAYVQDNELNWFLWDELEKNKERFDFISQLIDFRKSHPIFRKPHFLTEREVIWHDSEGETPKYSIHDRFVACTLKGNTSYYLAFHAGFNSVSVHLPPGNWVLVANTAKPWKEHNFNLANKTFAPNSIELPPHSALLLMHD